MRLTQNYRASHKTILSLSIGLLSILSFSAQSAIPASCEGVKEGLIACYPFDGNSNDLSGKNYHGVAKNITYVAGQAGQAAHFDGKTSYIEIASNQDLNSPQMTFTAWVKPTIDVNLPANAYDHHMIFNKELQYELAIFNRTYVPEKINAGELSFASGNNWTWMSSAGSFAPNKFVHVALAYTKDNMAKLYVDGKLVKEQKYNGGFGANDHCVRIGARNCPEAATYFFNGDMDEFRIYNRDLSETEIKQLAGVEIKPIEQPVIKHTLTVIKVGAGKGEVQAEDSGLKCSGIQCQNDYSNGSKVTLTASPLPNNVFKGWGNDCLGTNQKVTVTVDSAKKCTAVFMPEQAQEPTPPPPASFNLTVSKAGSGDVKSSDNSINCGAACQHSYQMNSNVSLTAVPAAGHLFKEWSGDCAGTNPMISLVIDKAKNCTATFVQQQAAPTPPPSDAPSQLCVNVTGTYGQDRVGYCNDYTFEGNNVPCVINKNGEIIAGECAQEQLNPKPLANNVLAYGKRAFVGKSFSATTPRCDSSVEFSAENKVKAPSNMAFLCVRYEKTAGSNSFYYGLAFVNNAQVLSYKLETTPDKCVGTCPK